MKYKLINQHTQEEHLCDKITIDDFDYYVNYPEKCCVKKEGKTIINKGCMERNHCEKVIATNNPNIDISKVVNEIERLTFQEFKDWSFGEHGPWHTYKMFQKGYSKSQETHPNSDEDMIEFVEWIANSKLHGYCKQLYEAMIRNKVSTTKELLQIWKEQQPRIVYYD